MDFYREGLMQRSLILLVTISLLFASIARADEEAANAVYVQSAEGGRFYAKCIPAEGRGSKGTTRVYSPREKEDELVQIYDWYAPEIALANTSKGIAIVRFGDWPRGHEATKDELAIAFYLNGKLLHPYSTLDIAGKPGNVSFSVSHYTVIKKHLGVRWITENTWVYDIQTTDDRMISFNVDTGEIVSTTTGPATQTVK